MTGLRADWLALDLRALAFFRIVLGLCGLADVALSAWQVEPFFTDHGILPRSDLQLPWVSRWFCVFLLGGESWQQLPWMLLAALCALLVIWGRHTRLALLCLWYLLACLHVRDSLPADRGAMLWEVMAFWGLFLPLDARWSWAAGRHPDWIKLPNAYRSLATVALFCQFSMIYFFCGLLKNGPEWVVYANATQLACASAQVSTAYSEWLSQFTEPLKWATVATIGLECLVPFWLLCPLQHRPLRLLTVAALVLFHLHNQLLFRLGFFPLMNALFILVLLPSPSSRAAAPLSMPFPAAYQISRASQLWLLLCLAYCFYANLQTNPNPYATRLAEPMRSFGKFFRLEQTWQLFSPIPPTDTWFRLLGHTSEGKEVSLWRRDGRITLEREVAPMASAPSHFWQMAMLNSIYREDPNLRRRLVDFWERQYSGQYRDLRYEAITQNQVLSQPRLRRLWPLHAPPPRIQL